MVIVTVLRWYMDAPQAVALGASAVRQPNSRGGHFYLAKTGHFYLALITVCVHNNYYAKCAPRGVRRTEDQIGVFTAQVGLSQ